MTSSIPIKVYTNDRGIASDLIEPEDGKMAAGETKTEIDHGTDLVYEGAIIRKSFGIGDIIQFSLMMGGNIASGVIAAWLYDRLKNREVTLEIDGEEVEMDEVAIQTRLDEFQE